MTSKERSSEPTSKLPSVLQGKSSTSQNALGQRHRPSHPDDFGDSIPLGEGRYQLLVLLATTLAGTSFLAHLAGFRFTTRVMDHWCRPPDDFANLSVADWRALATPLENDGRPSQCRRRDPPDAGTRALTVACEAWNFDLERYGNNVVSEWRLVCDRRWLIATTVLADVAACALWLPLAGVAADRLGRRHVMSVSLFAVLVAGFATSLSKSYMQFAAMRVVVSLSSNSFWLVLYVVLYEVATPASWERHCFSAVAVATILTPLLWLPMSRLRVGWQAVHLVLMVPTTVMAAAYSVVGHESPAWLLATRHAKKAELVALRVARMNGVCLDDCRAWFALEARKMERRDGSELLTTGDALLPIFLPEFRNRFLLLCYTWGSCGFAFSQVNLNDIVDVKEAVQTAGTAAMVLMHCAAFACVAQFGAKRSAVVTMLLFSILSVILTGTYDEQSEDFNGVLVVALRMLGNLSTVLTFLVTVQQFPIDSRCTCLCSGFALGRLAGSLGEQLFLLTPRHHRDVAISVVSVAVAFASVATEYLPFPAGGTMGGALWCPSSQSTRTSFATAQESLMSRPRGASNAPGKKQLRIRDDRDPEQHSAKGSSPSYATANQP